MAELVWTLEAARCLEEIHIVNEERIEILGIFHGAMDIERYLQLSRTTRHGPSRHHTWKNL